MMYLLRLLIMFPVLTAIKGEARRGERAPLLPDSGRSPVTSSRR